MSVCHPAAARITLFVCWGGEEIVDSGSPGGVSHRGLPQGVLRKKVESPTAGTASIWTSYFSRMNAPVGSEMIDLGDESREDPDRNVGMDALGRD